MVLRCFSSHGLLCISTLLKIQSWAITLMGLPHSDTCGSMLVWQLLTLFRGLLRPSSPVMSLGIRLVPLLAYRILSIIELLDFNTSSVGFSSSTFVRWDLFFVIHLMDQHVYYSWDYSPTLQSYSELPLRVTSKYFWKMFDSNLLLEFESFRNFTFVKLKKPSSFWIPYVPFRDLLSRSRKDTLMIRKISIHPWPISLKSISQF